jgi:hypothetical protein
MASSAPVKQYLATLIATAAGSLAGAPQSTPTSVTIVDVPSERRDYGINIGNVKVRFADGHSELWTNKGKCLIPHVSAKGYVGWTRYTSRNHYQEPVNDVLRVCFPDRTFKDFRAYPNGRLSRIGGSRTTIQWLSSSRVAGTAQRTTLNTVFAPGNSLRASEFRRRRINCQNGHNLTPTERTPNQSLEPTAGRSDASLFLMKPRPLQSTLALARGGSALSRLAV